MTSAVVIGAGLAGLTTALRLAEAGTQVTLVTKGIGGLQLGQGTIDVLGYQPHLVKKPLAALDADLHDNHPYKHFSSHDMDRALRWLRATVGDELLVGDGQRNYLLPTAAGVLRPTALAQPSMIAGEATVGKRYVIVGFNRLKDFYPDLVAQNLTRYRDSEGNRVQARSLRVDLQVRDGEEDTSGLNFARALDKPEARQRLADLLRNQLKPGETVGLPAVLGIKDVTAWQDIQTRLGHDIFEIPLPPPSVPGMRLNEKLMGIAKKTCRVINGAPVTSFTADNDHIVSVSAASAGRPTELPADHFVLATGGFESGGLVMDSYENVSEPIFGLPIAGTTDRPFTDTYWGEDQPAFLMGLNVNDQMHPCEPDSTLPVYSNLFAVGGLLAGATRWREKSGEGIALVSAIVAAESMLGEQK
ncbi:glycerol-3-phosphate dehydrogenase subunit GlpB [Actinomycetaceae bacterium WB03_NA08]|uniref:Glycerol-3-phosphate dehydrogenase subunit GlpB n=1 Tax=Scrofimicrobium canadense TaxID=2652290 RepID=A0A6N7VPL5_9ACTO|nr:glycerol-3-phosphate dehydrogenase subunit GlpB [Scrofimicrobium canadense]MSS83679.1 glycerol-3-phosphate dehydrogenase subunit GlpB [Scrofimicrobium canadense]